MRTAVVLSLCLASVGADVAWARPPHKQSLRRYYDQLLPPALHDCTTCHLTRQQAGDPADFDDAKRPHNAFGKRLRELRESLRKEGRPADLPTVLRAVAQEDSDEDGVPNEAELLTGHAPGIASDKPTADELAAARETLEGFARKSAGYRWEPFKTVIRPAVPRAERAEANLNAIDAFLAVEQESRGLKARPEAPRAVLLRRVTLDLIGLPPTPDELHAFLEDKSPDAYERVVGRLLASPHYGERWGRHWMDVWRYSDWAGWTDGKQIRDSQPHIWRWRDWIIQSLNEDKPYDRMVTEMLAADEIASTDEGALRATGFLARNYKMLSRETWMQDTVNHTTQAFLGLTVACARCHDHMYDAISHVEYYRLRAIFEPHQVRLDAVPGEPDTKKDGLARVYDADPGVSTFLLRKGDDRDPDKEHPLAPGVLQMLGEIGYDAAPIALPPEAWYPAFRPHVQRELIAAAEADIAKAVAALAQATAAVPAPPSSGPDDAATAEVPNEKLALAELSLAAVRARLASIAARIAADRAKYSDPPAANANDLALAAGKAEREAAFAQSVFDVANAEAKRTAAQIAVKESDAKTKQALIDAGKAVEAAVKSREAAAKARTEATANYSPLGPVYPKQSSGRRAALARWITDSRNPLTARVAVNQIWMRHFGQPLVPTVLDFGQNGQPPTHPALVDWLAAELMGSDDGRNVVESSSTAAQPAAPSAWSMKRLHRLIITSQAYRRASTPDDQNLAIDPDNHWLWRMPSRRMEAELVRDGILAVSGQLDVSMNGADIDHKQGLTVPRRSVYFQHAQEKQMEFLKMFDCASVSECYQRKESIIPQQALALANSELTLVQARRIARALHATTAGDDRSFVAAAFERVLSRPATTDEMDLLLRFLEEQGKQLAAAKDRLAATGGSPADFTKPAGEPILRLRENLVHVLLNHNDFVMIR